jgi:flagellar biosynthesis protein FlhG
MTEPIVKAADSIVEETRRAIQPFIFQRLESRRPKVPGQKIAQTITVTSGKGGVGKTSLVANLAICLAQSGKRVTILDADLGLANIDVVFGIRPKRNLADVINGTLSLEDIIIPGPCGIQIIAGGSGIPELVHLDPAVSGRLFHQLRFLEDKTDYLIIDTGAGISQNVVSFCLAADQILVLTTPEPTALADAYGIIKVIHSSRPTAHVKILVNRAENEDEAKFVLNRLSKVAMDFLDFPLITMGYLPEDKQMYLAVRQQTPLMLFSPMSPAARSLRTIVQQNFPDIPPAPEHEGIEGFLEKLARLFGSGAPR